MDRMAGLLATKDGVTVAREVDLPDHTENQGCQILKNACIKVNDEVGDGTTTVAVLAHALMVEGHKIISTGVDPGGLVRGMYAARDEVVDAIRWMSNSIVSQAELERVAMLASNGDTEIATNLAEACMAVGKDGTVTIEDGVGMETILEFKDGMEIDQGPCSPTFLGNATERVINTPLVAVIHSRLRSLEDVRDLMETASQWPNNELVVFCLLAEAEALAVMTANDSKGVMKCVAIGAPGVQFRKVEYLEDLAAMSGATMVDINAGMDHRKWNPEWFGSLRQITIKPKSTVMTSLPEAQESIAERMVALRAQEVVSVSDYDRDRIKERLAKLSGGLALLKIGGVTELAMKERRARVEDALGAVRAALRSGVVPGGGISYLRASTILNTKGFTAEDHGRRTLQRALMKPLEVIADNMGNEGKVVVQSVMEKWDPAGDDCSEGFDWTGWDASTETYRDLSNDPLIMDPTDVAVAVINAAVSVAATLLTVETAIVLQGTK
jgi:chaperonin GroEL